MRSARLTLALESSAFVPPADGNILVLRPHAGDDLSALPRDRVRVVTGFKPDHDWFAARGYAVSAQIDGPVAAALVCLPRAKDASRALVAAADAAVVPGGIVAVDGQKTDGIDAVLKDLRSHVALSEALSKAHGKIATFPAAATLTDWTARPTQVDGFQTLPGVFSADGPDRGSALLAATLPDLKGRIADLGAGWGYLSAAILKNPAVRDLHVVEAEADALDCARVNITDPRAQFHWADATTWKAPTALDAVVMNPPFHIGRDADPALGIAFIGAAARLLHPQGVLWLVANRHLPYDRPLTTLFRDVTDAGGDSGFRVIRASHPIRPR
jgi:16S rRNA (guanine1207-N2)-methyltransferase